eukprot:6818879-Alexandrium_andersonii.AAC.1
MRRAGSQSRGGAEDARPLADVVALRRAAANKASGDGLLPCPHLARWTVPDAHRTDSAVPS